MYVLFPQDLNVIRDRSLFLTLLFGSPQHIKQCSVNAQLSLNKKYKMLKMGHIYISVLYYYFDKSIITGITQDRWWKIHSSPHLILNKIIQVSGDIMISLKLIFVLKNVFCFVIITIYLKMQLSIVLLIF